MTTAEELVVPQPATNGVTSNGTIEAVTRRAFELGPCSHQSKSKLVKGKGFKEALKKDKAASGKKCIECVRKELKVTDESNTICLSCGLRLCESHAIAHSRAPRSGDEHPLYYDQDEERVRCFACEVSLDSADPPTHIRMVLNDFRSLWKGKTKDSGDKAALTEPAVLDRPNANPEKKAQMNGHTSSDAANGVDDGSQKANGGKKRREPPISERVPASKENNGYAASSSSNGSAEAVEKARTGLATPRTTAIPAKGLANLGNTCFFNSVAQCLLHTHQLAFYLEKFGRVSRLNFPKPPKPIVVNDEKVEVEAATLSIRASSTPLNDALKSFVIEFWNGYPSPRGLFDQIARKAARFRSMAQQDAHELLRYLMDGLCSEETDRYKAAIAELVGASIKAAERADPEVARRAKAYLQLAGRPLLDAVFGGRLLQTIRCSKCDHVSDRYENMYDLSVPLTGTGSASRTRSGALQIPSTSSTSSSSGAVRPPSKHQLKKEAKKNKKNSRTTKSSISKEASKTGEDGSIEAQMAELRVNGDAATGSSGEEEEGEEKPDERESSGAEDNSDNNSYRPEDKTVNPLDLTKVLTPMTTSLPSGQSIAASLLEFCAEERLQGANAYECENCCTPVNKKKGATGAAKMRVEATKRYLIITPPVVLTMHVKRFQQLAGLGHNAKMTTRKVSGHVHFPLIFDIAPFCCKHVERIAPGQTQILYSLYGVVSHSGNLSGGHYVAYVKSRERIGRTEEMLEAARAVCADVQAEPAAPSTPAPPPITPEQAVKEVPGGQWYYCSDSRVSAISESKVLNEEAYLLFYERIF